jgi:N-acetylmuramoyl-L-alanine amidase
MKKFLKLLTGSGEGNKSAASAFYDDLTLDVFARTIWGEARGEGTFGMEAVANVVANRVKAAQARGGYWWGDNIISVCQKPYQFSCWNRSDPNYKKLQAVTEKDLHYATAVRIARRAMAGTLDDATHGATHYHARSITPGWAEGQNPSAVIGNHIFYRLSEV